MTSKQREKLIIITGTINSIDFLITCNKLNSYIKAHQLMF